MNFHEAAHHFETDKGPRTPSTRGGSGGWTGHGYTLAYEREFGRFTHCNVNLLEIGVQMGCSARLWDWYAAKYLPTIRGSSWTDLWTIVGCEISIVPGLRETLRATLIRPDRLHLVEGDSTLPETQLKVMQALNSDHPEQFDIIIDDGSHLPATQIATLANFWPLVKPGGIYCLEDLHESWWPKELQRGSIMPVLHGYTEDAIGRGKFAEWSGIPPADPVPTRNEEALFSVRYYRNLCVLEKRQ